MFSWGAGIPAPSEQMVEEYDILIAAILQQETAGNDPQPHKSQFLVQGDGRRIAAYHGVELQDAKPQFLSFLHAVCYQLFPDMLSSPALFYSVAGIADMPAAPDIIRVKDIQTGNLTAFFIVSNAGKRLFPEKFVSGFRRQ